jgi:hypothetical protein
MFQTEYRLSTWHFALLNFSPYIMIAGLLGAILVYLLYLVPAGGGGSTALANILPNIDNLPSATSATNMVTSGINQALNVVNNVATNVSNSVTNTVKNVVGNAGNMRNRNTLGFPLSQI